MPASFASSFFGTVALLLGAATITSAQPAAHRKEFPPGALQRLEELPASKLRRRVDQLPAQARERALAALRNFHFTTQDLDSMDADQDGGIYYVDEFKPLAADAVAETDAPVASTAAVPVSPFPRSLVFHSRPGASNVIFINFCGETVTGSAWNSTIGRTSIVARPFSKDTDYTTFSDAEQLVIKGVWERMAEDYAPFNVDVTTERPETLTTRTAMALVTPSTDANGDPNPSSTGGGIAYVNMFGTSPFPSYRPAWIYCNNLSGSESYIAEAASHEIGHNMGLSHDGTSTADYYGGHGSGNTSWGPIMGTGYDRNVSQWSKGEYYNANNTQDDLATISGKLGYRPDDHGDTAASATRLVLSGTNVVSTTLETDPTNGNTANKGVLERNTDVDVFTFDAGGAVKLTVTPWTNSMSTKGGNLDVALELRDAANTVLATNNPATDTFATVQATLAQGTYYLYVRNTGAGAPTNSSPTGYTSYASIGQYFVNGYVTPSTAATPLASLSVSVNNAALGAVSTAGGTFPLGTAVMLTATPSPYGRFVGWSGAYTGTSNPLTLVVATNATVQAIFADQLSAAHSTPYSWLAAFGYTNNIATAELLTGANGLPLWQSYIAGLQPNNAASTLALSVTRSSGQAVLTWSPVSGRVYTIYQSTNVSSGYAPVASNLPATMASWTNSSSGAGSCFYRLGVQLP